MSRPITVLTLTALLALACGGGGSVDAWTHLQPVCAAGAEVPNAGALVPLDVAAEPLPRGVRLDLDPTGARLDWRPVQDEAELTRRIADRFEELQAIGEYKGETPERTVVVSASPETPMALVGQALRASHAAGFPSVDLVVASREPHALPPAPDPAYAKELEARLGEVSPDQRATLAAREVEGLLSLCPGGQEVFAAVAHASPEHKCELMARGLSEALPGCPLTDADRVITATQVIVQPAGAHRPAVIRVHPDPSGTPLPVDPDATWSSAAAGVAALEGQALWFP